MTLAIVQDVLTAVVDALRTSFARRLQGVAAEDLIKNRSHLLMQRLHISSEPMETGAYYEHLLHARAPAF